MPGSRAPSDARTQGVPGLVCPGATEDAAARRVIAGQGPPNVAGRATTLACQPPAHVLAGIANALPLVRLRRAHLADLGRGLSDLLFVDAFDDDLGVRRHLEGDALRCLDH